MLQLMLHAHPRIALPPENRFVLPAYSRRHEFGDLTRAENRLGLARWIVGEKAFGDLGLDARQVVDDIMAAPPTLGSAVGTVLRAYAAKFGKPRWGDKRPAYLRHLDVIFKLFPDAQIVNIVRDGRDCVASLKEVPWRQRSFAELIDFWARAADETRKAARRLDPTTYHQVRYEDLVRSPETHLRALCDFLDEEYDPAMARPGEQARVAVPEYKVWHKLTHGDVTTERVKSWQTRLTADEIRLCEAAFGHRLVQFGYELSGTGVPGPRHRARYAWHTASYRLAPARRALVNARDRLRPHGAEPPVAARLTTRQLAGAPAQR